MFLSNLHIKIRFGRIFLVGWTGFSWNSILADLRKLAGLAEQFLG